MSIKNKCGVNVNEPHPTDKNNQKTCASLTLKRDASFLQWDSIPAPKYMYVWTIHLAHATNYLFFPLDFLVFSDNKNYSLHTDESGIKH